MSSPAVSLKAACDALALRFVAATLGTPTGAQPMRGSFGQMPKAVNMTPFHYLEVLDGTLVANPGQWKHEWKVDGILCLDKRPGDPVRVDAQRQLWLPYLLHATEDALKITLGAGVGWTVDKAIPDAGWEWDEVEVAGNTYDAIRVHWTIYVTETVSLTP